MSAGLLRALVEQRPAILEKLHALLEARRRQSGQPPKAPATMLATLRQVIFGA